MATFMTNLWESVFTPGPTPTLLIATNATFGTLQLLLFVLLLTTSSIHFAILSLLCAGLWYSINWFAREVQAAKAAEDAAAVNPSSKDKQSPTDTRQTSPDPTGSDTETETDPIATTATGSNPTRTAAAAPAQQRRKPPPPQPGQAPMPPPTSAASSSSSRAPAVTSAPVPREALAPPTKQPSPQHLSPNRPTASAPGTDGAQDLSASTSGRRRPSMGDSSGYVSTDSEWEKVSDQEGK